MGIETAGSARLGSVKFALALGAILIAAFAYQVPYVLNPDLAWLLTVAERMLEGQRLGVDIYELNPPASVIIYMVPALLGQHTPIAAHIWVIAETLALSGGSVLLAVRILGSALGSPAVRRRAAILLLVILTLAPLRNFAEREHLGVVLLLPVVALASRFDRDDPPRRALCVLAGILAGIAMCMKPYFAAMAGVPLLWNALSTRRARALFGIESWTAAAVVIAYVLWVMLVFPAYFHEYTRVIALVYLPYRMPLPYMLTSGLAPFAALFLGALYLTRGSEEAQWRGSGAWLGAVLGAVLCYIAQAKGFGYSQLPMVLFALIAIAMAPAVLHQTAAPAAGALRRVAAMALGAGLMLLPTPGENRAAEFIGAVRELGPPRPSILVISDASEIGQPLTRLVGGTWASAKGSMLEAGGAVDQLAMGVLPPADAAFARAIIAHEQRRIRDDLVDRRPDILMIDAERSHAPFDWLGWMRQDPVTASELDNRYRLARRIGRVGIWVRRADAGPAGARAKP